MDDLDDPTASPLDVAAVQDNPMLVDLPEDVPDDEVSDPDSEGAGGAGAVPDGGDDDTPGPEITDAEIEALEVVDP